MHNRKYAAEIAHNVSSLKRKAIVERAREVRKKAPCSSAACFYGNYEAHSEICWDSVMLCDLPCSCIICAKSVSLHALQNEVLPYSNWWAMKMVALLQLNINVTNADAKLRSQEDE